MNRENWFAIGVIIFFILAAIFLNSCALLQPGKPKPVEPPLPIDTIVKPAVQLWYAAKTSNWLVTMSILGIAGGVFATLNGQKWGLAVVVSCSVSLFMSLAVARFAWWMAICGLFGSVGLCIASILARKKALVEIIKGVQRYKDKADERSKAYIKDDLLDQSKSTQKIVQNIKSDLKVKGEI